MSSPPVSSAARERSSVDSEIARSMIGDRTFWTAALIAVLSMVEMESEPKATVADLLYSCRASEARLRGESVNTPLAGGPSKARAESPN